MIRLMNPSRLLLLLLAALVPASPAMALEKWIYAQRNLQVEKSADELIELMRRGKAAGYTHVLVSDSKFSRLATVIPQYFKNAERVKQAAQELGMEIVPAVCHVGYSNNMLWADPNLVEAMPVKDLPLVVQGGVARVDDPDAPRLPGGDFTDLKRWSWSDPMWHLDDGAARVTDPKGANARIVQKLKVKPFRQYHVSVRVKTQDFKGKPEVKVLPANGTSLTWDNLRAKPTQDWATHDIVFNSQNNTDVQLYLGAWGASTGSLWFDDAKLEEIAFVNLARRGGCPLEVRTAEGKTLIEGTDFEPLKDPLMGSKPWPGEYDVFHAAPELRTNLPDGTKLTASYYHAVTIYDGQAMVCPSEPKTMELIRDEVKRTHALFGAKGYMMSHDEVRVLNWCKACQDRNTTPGQILAENVKACTELIREIAPGAKIYVWNDMFDPHHNAKAKDYYLVNGTLEGSWEGLAKDVIILPWYFEKRAESLKFFADRGHRQVIAGYYDARPEQIADWLTAARAVPGSVVGVMYTTWESKYADLEKFSEAASAAMK